MASKIDKFLKSANALLGDKELMYNDVTEMTPESLVSAFLVLDGLLKEKSALNERKKEIRERLLEITKDGGKVKDKEKGHQILTVAGSLVTRERRIASMPDEKSLKDLVTATKGVEMKDVTTVVKNVNMDASKIKALVTLGKLDEKKVEKLKKITWALKVKASEVAGQLLEDYGLVPVKK